MSGTSAFDRYGRTSTPIKNLPTQHNDINNYDTTALTYDSNHLHHSGHYDSGSYDDPSYHSYNNTTVADTNQSYRQPAKQQNIQANTSTNSPAKLIAQIKELQRNISDLALENEELKYELKLLRDENTQLSETIDEKEAIQTKMDRQLETVTKIAQTFYEKFRAFKYKYYQTQQNAWIGCANDEQ